VDLPTAAFVVWAAVLEARQPRRGSPVLVLLALAGLLRPEAWLYAGAYWLWLRAPLRLLPLAAAAPLIWMGSDLAITGNALHSLTGTHDLAAQLGRKTGITAVPQVAPRRLGEILRLPELLAAVAGFAFGVAWLRGRVALPVAVAALNGVAYVAFGIARLPLLGRYLFVAASMLAVLAGAGFFGWLALPREQGGGRRAWAVTGCAALAVVLVFFPLQQAGRLEGLRDDIAARDRIQADLHDLVRSPAGKRALARCPVLHVVSHRPIPLLALWTDRRTSRIRVGFAPTCTVVPATPEVARLAVLDPNEPTPSGAWTRHAPLPAPAQNRSWILLGP
jgi:hypothetical protein